MSDAIVAEKRIVTSTQADTIAETVSGLFSLLADAMPQMVWATDPHGSHFYFNRRWYEYTGLSETQSLGFGFATVLHPVDVERTLKDWKQAWEQGADYEIEYRIRRHDGVYRWFVGRAMPIRDTETGQIRMWVGTCTDIDDQRRALEELRESQSRLSVALQAAQLGTWEYDPLTRRLIGSARSLEMYGFAPDDEPSATEWIERVHEEDRERISDVVSAYARGDAPYAERDANFMVSYRIVRPDGTARHLVSMGARISTDDPYPGRSVGVMQDVTESFETLEALRESEERFRSVVSNAPIIVFAVDRDGVFTFRDGKALAAIGGAPGEAVGRSFADVYPDNPTLVENVRRALRGEITSWTALIGDVVFETQCTPLYDDAGAIDSVIGVAFDVTERRRAEAALRTREEQYRTLTEVLPQVIWSGDAGGEILYCNRYWYEYTDFSPEQTVGTGWMNAVHMEDREGVWRRWSRAMETETGFELEMRLRRSRDAAYRWFLVRGRPVRNPQTNRVEQWLGTALDIHDRWEASEALRDSEERFRTMADNIAQLAWMTDGTGYIFWYNQRWFDFTGTTLEEMEGWGWRSVHHPDYVDAVAAKFSAAIAAGEFWEDTFPLRSKEGAYRWFLSRAIPIRDETGQVVRWFGTNTDVTEQREAEQALRQSEERFRSLVEATAQIVWTTNAGGEFVSEQSQWADLTGQSLDQYLGYGWLQAVHPDDRDPTTVRWAQALAKKTPCEMEYRLRRYDGEYRWFAKRAVPVLDADGQVREWIGVETDIHARKRAERALRESEERFRSLTEATTQIIWGTDAAGEFVGEQPGWAAFTGQSPAQYRGWGWMDAVHEDGRAETLRIWRRAVANQTHYYAEHRLRRADGVYRYMSVRAVPILDADGGVREWIGVHTDITERKEAEQALAEYATRQAHVAETLQRTLLTPLSADGFAGITVYAHYEAAWTEAQVGGDFFDVFALDGGKVALVVGDVTGKGLKAAEHTGQIKYATRVFLRESADPGEALARLNKLLTDAERLDGPADAMGAMAAIAVAVLEPASGILHLAGGGSESPLHYVRRTGRAEELRPVGTVAGAYAQGSFPVMTRVLEPGDLLLIATDGITEARRSRREFFGIEGFAESVERVASRTDDPTAVAVAVIEAAKGFAGGALRDDVCLLAVRQNESKERQ